MRKTQASVRARRRDGDRAVPGRLAADPLPEHAAAVQIDLEDVGRLRQQRQVQAAALAVVGDDLAAGPEDVAVRLDVPRDGRQRRRPVEPPQGQPGAVEAERLVGDWRSRRTRRSRSRRPAGREWAAAPRGERLTRCCFIGPGTTDGAIVKTWSMRWFQNRCCQTTFQPGSLSRYATGSRGCGRPTARGEPTSTLWSTLVRSAILFEASADDTISAESTSAGQHEREPAREHDEDQQERCRARPRRCRPEPSRAHWTSAIPNESGSACSTIRAVPGGEDDDREQQHGRRRARDTRARRAASEPGREEQEEERRERREVAAEQMRRVAGREEADLRRHEDGGADGHGQERARRRVLQPAPGRLDEQDHHCRDRHDGHHEDRVREVVVGEAERRGRSGSCRARSPNRRRRAPARRRLRRARDDEHEPDRPERPQPARRAPEQRRRPRSRRRTAPRNTTACTRVAIATPDQGERDHLVAL